MVSAYLLCGTDFTPKHFSLTNVNALEAYHAFAIGLPNASLVKKLGARWTSSPGKVFDTRDVELKSLVYFSRNRKLFQSAGPGRQIDESGESGRQPSEPRMSVHSHSKWITSLHN